MLVTNPVNAPIPENCTQSSMVDESVYVVAPASGAAADPLNPGKAAVVVDQTTYTAPLTFAELVHSSATEWRLVDPLRAAAAKPGTDFTQAMSFPPPAGWDQRAPLQTLKVAARALGSNGDLSSQHQI